MTGTWREARMGTTTSSVACPGTLYSVGTAVDVCGANDTWALMHDGHFVFLKPESEFGHPLRLRGTWATDGPFLTFWFADLSIDLNDDGQFDSATEVRPNVDEARLLLAVSGNTATLRYNDGVALREDTWVRAPAG